ncbi:MarR family transcriptional regulator [Clostridium oceanicum]|uniref:MarR family winged helix-turn-helix transcriptional regulator n=1 Tax=Clostridium oceanicum TaxID=1543 RepID=A0ABP3UQ52_9CLOT
MEDKTKQIGKHIGIINRMGKCYISKKLEKYNIGSGQYIFLIYLFNNNGMSQENISEALHINKGTTARAIKKLEKEGYVYREIDGNDKRINRIFITKEGLNIKKVIYESIKKWNEIVYKDFEKEEKESMVNLLERAIKNYSTYKSQLD